MTKLRLVIPKAPLQPLELLEWEEGGVPCARIEGRLQSTHATSIAVEPTRVESSGNVQVNLGVVLANYAREAAQSLDECLETLAGQGDGIERRRAVLELALAQRQQGHKLLQVSRARLADHALVRQLEAELAQAGAKLRAVADSLYLLAHTMGRHPQLRVSEALEVLGGNHLCLPYDLETLAQSSSPSSSSSSSSPSSSVALHRWLRRALVERPLAPFRLLSMAGETVEVELDGGGSGGGGWRVSCAIHPLGEGGLLGWVIRGIASDGCLEHDEARLVAWLGARLNHSPVQSAFWITLAQSLRWWDRLARLNRLVAEVEERLQREALDYRGVWLEEATWRLLLWPHRAWRHSLELACSPQQPGLVLNGRPVEFRDEKELAELLLEGVHREEAQAWFSRNTVAEAAMLTEELMSLPHNLFIWWDRQAGHPRCSSALDWNVAPLEAVLAQRGSMAPIWQKMRADLEGHDQRQHLLAEHGDWLVPIDEMMPLGAASWLAVKSIRSLYVCVQAGEDIMSLIYLRERGEDWEIVQRERLDGLDREKILALGWAFELEQAGLRADGLNAGLPNWASSLEIVGIGHLLLHHQSPHLPALLKDEPGYTQSDQRVEIRMNRRISLSVLLRRLTRFMGMAEMARIISRKGFLVHVRFAQLEICQDTESLLTICLGPDDRLAIDESPRLSEHRKLFLMMVEQWEHSWNCSALLRLFSLN